MIDKASFITRAPEYVDMNQTLLETALRDNPELMENIRRARRKSYNRINSPSQRTSHAVNNSPVSDRFHYDMVDPGYDPNRVNVSPSLRNEISDIRARSEDFATFDDNSARLSFTDVGGETVAYGTGDVPISTGLKLGLL